MKKLGKVQESVLDALKQHGGWSPGGGWGWHWDTESGTKRIMESLVRAGYATVREEKTPRGMRTVYRAKP